MATMISGDVSNKEYLWRMACCAERQVAVNALWIMTYLCKTERKWIASLADGMIVMLLVETDQSKKRLLLQILRSLDYGIENIRTDFLDWCLSKINAECEPYAVRAYCIHIAFKMCRYYPELISELESRLEILSFQPLSPGLASAGKATVKAINKIRLHEGLARQ